MLLDSLGDSEVQVSDEGCSELLHRLLKTGERFTKIDPTHIDSIPKISADQWSSMEEVEKERQRCQEQVKEAFTAAAAAAAEGDEEEENLDEKYGGPVDENLAAHVSFTLSLLERLCNAINDSSGNSLQVDAVNALNEMRELRAEKLLLTDRITKLSSEIIDVSAKLRLAETEKLRAERDLDRAVLAAKEAERAALNPKPASDGTTTAEGGGQLGADGTTGSAAAVPTSPQASNPTMERELRRQVTLLERQLAESESAKAAVEMTLTERLARPLPQTEVQVADMRTAMEELRQQCKHRVSALIAEVSSTCLFHYLQIAACVNTARHLLEY